MTGLFYLVKIVKEFENGEDAGSYEETHLTPDVTWRDEKEEIKNIWREFFFVLKN